MLISWLGRHWRITLVSCTIIIGLAIWITATSEHFISKFIIEFLATWAPVFGTVAVIILAVATFSEIRESHQKGKADTSGTARAMIKAFNQLGIPFSEKDIQMQRDPEVQKTQWGIPETYLVGHGWHTYTLVSKDSTVKFVFTHNVNGRDVYADGTLDAAVYLSEKVEEGVKGTVFTMIDVLKGH